MFARKIWERNGLQRYGKILKLPNFLQLFFKNFFTILKNTFCTNLREDSPHSFAPCFFRIAGAKVGKKSLPPNILETFFDIF